ncbi:histidine kinase [Fibrisoma montanum]|uniref:Histidine kinase n=1 Tax=Fibrisoma montanum TaxID=2305895 RepID=A0A418LYU8_9BACT|nr:histidine kinase [Fibrisoma montanum]RIV18534.1 histidine kinase [Fibrisoma montanum]
MSTLRKPYPALLLAVVLISLLTYWGRLIYVGVWQNDETAPDIGGLARYLLGVVVLLTALWGLAYANYRLAFRGWLLRQETRLLYWTWLCVLAWLVFELLQRRTDHEPEFADENLLVTGVIMVFIIAFGYIADSFRARREQVYLIQQKTEAELTALKAQVNPHFLFNALNTIYNEAQRADNETVADLIQQLSGIMRFTLQESRQPLTSIDNELQFLDKYLALQRARLPETDNLQLSTQLDWDGQPAQIAPLLLIPFVENAFQYGISFVQPSYIDLTLTVENRRLVLHLANSVPSATTGKHGSGTGIANARQRLALMYAGRHTLAITQTSDTFTVALTLDL